MREYRLRESADFISHVPEELNAIQKPTYLLLHVEDRDMGRNSNFSATQSTQQSTLSDTVLTNQTVAMTVSQCQRSIRQYPQATNRDVDSVHLDVLALGLRVRAHLQRVDSHVELFIGLRRIRLVEQSRCLIFHVLHDLLLLLRANLLFRLLKLLPIHTRFHLPGICRL